MFCSGAKTNLLYLILWSTSGLGLMDSKSGWWCIFCFMITGLLLVLGHIFYIFFSWYNTIHFSMFRNKAIRPKMLHKSFLKCMSPKKHGRAICSYYGPTHSLHQPPTGFRPRSWHQEEVWINFQRERRIWVERRQMVTIKAWLSGQSMEGLNWVMWLIWTTKKFQVLFFSRCGRSIPWPALLLSR